MALVGFEQCDVLDVLQSLAKGMKTNFPSRLYRVGFKLIADHSSLKNINYWTSGYDQNGPGKYSWCSAGTNALVEGVNWKPGAVSTLPGCIRVFFPSTGGGGGGGAGGSDSKSDKKSDGIIH
jgi:hypothetical protein